MASVRIQRMLFGAAAYEDADLGEREPEERRRTLLYVGVPQGEARPQRCASDAAAPPNHCIDNNPAPL